MTKYFRCLSCESAQFVTHGDGIFRCRACGQTHAMQVVDVSVQEWNTLVERFAIANRLSSRDEMIVSCIRRARDLGFVYQPKMGLLVLLELKSSLHAIAIELKTDVDAYAGETNVFGAALRWQWTKPGAAIILVSPWAKQEAAKVYSDG